MYVVTKFLHAVQKCQKEQWLLARFYRPPLFKILSNSTSPEAELQNSLLQNKYLNLVHN